MVRGRLEEDGCTCRFRFSLASSWHESVVVNASTQRKTRTCSLWDPPHPPHPRMFARHHAVSDIIQNRGRNLRGEIHCVGVGERSHDGIAFDTIVAGNCAPRGIGIQYGCTVSKRNQTIPNLAFASCFIASVRGRLRWCIS